MSDEVRALSTRVVNPRRASIGYSVVCLLVLASLWPVNDAMWAGADDPPPALQTLLATADPVRERTTRSPSSVAVLLLDGLRADEAAAMPAFAAFAEGGASGTMQMPSPTLSSPAYHLLLTGVPRDVSGVRTNRVQFRPEGTQARADTLVDRARAVGLSLQSAAEGFAWLLRFAQTEAEADAAVLPEGAPFDEAALELLRGAGEPGRFTLVHMLGVDESAHEGGIHSTEHRRALERAAVLVHTLHEAVRGTSTVAIVLADHGHLTGGGHGGGEPEVRTAPFAIRASGARAASGIELAPEDFAPTVAVLAGLDVPRHALGRPSDAVQREDGGVGGGLEDPALVSRTARINALAGPRAVHTYRGLRRRFGLCFLAILLAFMGLGATKRSFSGFDRGTYIAPAAWLVLSLLAHRWLHQKVFSLSALDRITTAVLTDGFTSAGIAGVCIYGGARAAMATGVPGRMAARRAAGGVAWLAIAAFFGSVARCGASLSPWPDTDLAAYGPVLFGGLTGGAMAAVALTLLASVAIRGESRYAPAGPPGSIALRAAPDDPNALGETDDPTSSTRTAQ